MKIQDIFQGTFKFISIMAQFLYLRRQAVEHTNPNVNKNPRDETVCRYLFTAKLLYMFRVSQHPSSCVLKTVTSASGTGHNIGTATCPTGTRWREVAVPVL